MKLPSAAEQLIESQEKVQHVTQFLLFKWDILCKEVSFRGRFPSVSNLLIQCFANMWISASPNMLNYSFKCWNWPLCVPSVHHSSHAAGQRWWWSLLVWLVATRPSHRIFHRHTRSHAPQLIGSDCRESALWLMIMFFIDLLLLEAILGSILSLLCILLFFCLLLFFS